MRNFIELHAKKNRRWKETERIFNTYVLPEWRDFNIGDINRQHVAASGGYCAPKSDKTPAAIPKIKGQQCPSDWAQSGSYCLDKRSR